MQNRKCAMCSEVEGRDATPLELAFMPAPVTWSKLYENGKWTGKWICSRCNNRIKGQLRSSEPTPPLPSKVEQCRAKHGIITRIVKGQPACILHGTSEMIHHGAGCEGCRFAGK